jgi:CheY-like chemotaxis protein
VRLAREEQPDCVVMDINLPQKMDGIESMSKILRDNRNVPVIINTGYSEYQDHFMCWAAEAYVLKSADTRPLLDAVEKVLQKQEQ